MGVRPAGFVSHHIVAGKASAAAKARAVLRRFGIKINDPVNGVYLPGSKAAQAAAASSATVHAGGHSSAYYEFVNEMLEAATTRQEAETILWMLRSMLLAGALKL